MRDWAAVFFDLDGTVADTVELILRSYRHTMKRHLGEELPDSRWLATLGTPLHEQLKGFARDGEELDRMVDTYVSFQRGIHDDLVAPYPGVPDAVAALRARGVPTAIVTSKRRQVAERTVACCGLTGAFEFLVCADDVAQAKPDPEPVHLALVRSGVADASATLFVGDSPFDLIAGRGAGTRTAAALWGPFRRARLEEADPDYWLATAEDVLGIRPGD